MNVGTNINDEDICLIDSVTTHTILKSNTFFSCLVMREVNVSIIIVPQIYLKALEELPYF